MRSLKIRRYAVHREILTDLVAQHRRFGLVLGWHAVVGEAQCGQGIGPPRPVRRITNLPAGLAYRPVLFRLLILPDRVRRPRRGGGALPTGRRRRSQTRARHRLSGSPQVTAPRVRRSPRQPLNIFYLATSDVGESNMPFTVIEGTFHTVGRSPDGDSLEFRALNPAHWAKLDGPPPKRNS